VAQLLCGIFEYKEKGGGLDSVKIFSQNQFLSADSRLCQQFRSGYPVQLDD